MPGCGGRRSCGAAATNARERRPTGPSSRRCAATSESTTRSSSGASSAAPPRPWPRSCPRSPTKLPGLAPLPAAEPAQARFRLFDSVTAFLRAASAEQPILFVLDDLHWADAGTLALLEFLARDLEGSRLLVVGTYRDVELTKGHPLAATLAELTRERVYERVL